MPVRKRNEFLDAGDSGDEENFGSEQEAGADSRTAGLVSRSSKRQKLIARESASEDDSDDAGSIEHQEKESEEHHPANALSPVDPPEKSSLTLLPPSKHSNRALSAPISKHKPGVVYLSRIPPFMRPSTVKSLLSTHGPITKIFLTPEPPTTYLRRKKGGGNKKHSFIDGWIEFERKKHAKQCVDAINGQTVGGKKGGWYRDDVWNAKYLRGFGWGDLMQGVRAEEREREERVRVGTKREGRERGEFLKNLERSKVEETRRQKRMKKEANERPPMEGDGMKTTTTAAPATTNKGDVESKQKGFERRFRQNEVKGTGCRQPQQPDEVQRVLSKIF